MIPFCSVQTPISTGGCGTRFALSPGEASRRKEQVPLLITGQAISGQNFDEHFAHPAFVHFVRRSSSSTRELTHAPHPGQRRPVGATTWHWTLVPGVHERARASAVW